MARRHSEGATEQPSAVQDHLRWSGPGVDSRYMLWNEQRLSARDGPEPASAGAPASHRVVKLARRGLVVAAAVMGVAVVGAIPAVGLAPPRHLGGSVVTAPSQAQPQGLLGQATHEYATMTATKYQAALRVDLSKGTYFYDCVGFVTYALGQAAPQARTTIMTKFNIAPNRIPSPARYVTLFGQPRRDPTRLAARPPGRRSSTRGRRGLDVHEPSRRERPRIRRRIGTEGRRHRPVRDHGLGFDRDATRVPRHSSHQPEEPAGRQREAFRARERPGRSGHGRRGVADPSPLVADRVCGWVG